MNTKEFIRKPSELFRKKGGYVIKKMQPECLEFQKKVWNLKLQIRGKKPFPDSGLIRTKWLQYHRDECKECRDWLTRVMTPYWEYLQGKFSHALREFAKSHGLSKKQIAEMLRLWHDDRPSLRARPFGREFGRLIKFFRTIVQLPLDDFREMLVNWLQENDPQ